jgi:hypothetical protein
MIHLRVVEAIQQVNGAGSRGGQAYAEIASELGVGARHERGHLLMPHLHEIELVAGAGKRADEAIDPVSGETKDALYSPGGKPFPEKIAYCFCHITTSYKGPEADPRDPIPGLSSLLSQAR